MVSGILTAILLAAFLALTAWAYSPRRRGGFAEAAALPLADDISADNISADNISADKISAPAARDTGAP